jgi:protein SCO1/2
MAQVQTLLGDRMGKDVFFYSITIDPEHDTPAVLKEYAEKYHAGPGWLFLTGDAKDIELIGRKIGLYSEPNPANKDGHTASVLIGNEATGQWLRNSATDNPRFLANIIANWMNSWRTAKPGKSYATAPKLSLDLGEYAFSSHCAPCHTIGGGHKIGPDLAGVTKKRDPQWLARFIASPERLLTERDPLALDLFEKYKPVRMPSFNLNPTDTAAIIGYIDKQTANAAAGGLTSGARSPTIEPSGARTAGHSEGSSSATRPAGSAAVLDVAAMLNPYLSIQEALASDRLDAIGGNANAIRAAVTATVPFAEAIRTASLALASASDLPKARAAFAMLGDALIASAKASNASLGEDVKVAYCPMANKYWLQKGEEIRNPFYGKAMLDCGRFVEQIPGGTGVDTRTR